jgi:glycyl-tRNA synthetase
MLIDKKRDNIVLSLDPKLAPIKAAVFPLVSKGEVFEVAKEVYRDLLEDFNVFFDSSGSIGRRYARQDEGGTPFCITVDQQSLEDKKVTIRERDSMKQIRVDACKIRELIGKLVTDDIGFSEAGEAVK